MTANAKNLSTLANVLDDGTSGQILQSTGSGGVVFANIAAGASVYDSAALLPLAGNDAGDMAFVTATSHFYINNGTGWYSVNLINTDPAITSVQDASANTTPFTLSTDGSATVITVTANDPENVPLTYSYAVTTGSLTNGGGTTATVTQSDNVFTVTPSTTEAYAGTFNLTFTASDGINTATSDNSFTLQFITTITNSNYTTLLATATPKNTTVYRYFKFLPQAMRSATPDAMQYSEFELTDGTSYYSPSSASQLYRADDTDGDDYAANQNVAASIDGSTSTKLYNGGWASKYYLYDMGSSFSTALTGWRYKTGNDMDSRDPISWTLLGSTNNTDWVLLDQRVNETITTSRQTATQDFTFNATNQAFFNAANSNYPIAVTGDAHAGTFSPYRSGGYSMFFNNDGTTSQIKYSENTNFNMGTNAFTIEGWIRPNETGSGSRRFYQNRYSSTGNGRGSIFQNGSNLYMSYRGDNGTDYELGPYSVLSVNTWTHFCLLRNTSDNTLKLYADGILLGSIAVPSNVGIYTSSSNTYIGVGFRGDMANIRVVNGTAITPSSSSIAQALENVTNTVLLLNEGSVTNYSSVSMPYEAVNLPTIKPYGPLDYVEYSATDHGGSVYFDGTGDYLTLGSSDPMDFGSGDWTISMWLYPTELTNNNNILDWRNSSGAGNTNFHMFGNLDGSITLYISDGASYILNGVNLGTTPLKEWTYFVVSRSGSTVTGYINGNAGTAHSISGSMANTAHSLYISRDPAGSGRHWHGYISDLRIDKGTATSSVSVPTSPESSTGIDFHLKGTDASIIDKAQGANLKLIGNTTGSTTQVKFAGSKSMYFDGTGDYITTDPSAFYFGTGDYSIEFWYYANNLNSQHTMVDLRSSGTNGFYPLITQQSSVMKYYVNTAFQITGTTTLSATTWYHVALVRNSGTTTLYLNGSSEGNTWTDSTNFPLSATAIIGSNYSNNTGVNGYLQDFRVSNYARYTANFTPPTASLEG